MKTKKLRNTCLWIIPIRLGVFIISLLITTVSATLIAATFLHRNRMGYTMMIHLSIIHTMLPWLYIAGLAVSGVIGLFGIMATITGNHGIMILYRIIFWLMAVIIVYVWQIILFILSLVNRSNTIGACLEMIDREKSMNQTIINDTDFTLLGLEFGDAYGLANCNQAAEAGIIGLATLLLVGGVYVTWFGVIVHRCTQSMSSTEVSSRVKRSGQIDSYWENSLDQLQSAYARDKVNSNSKFPLKDLSKQNKFSRGLIKMKANNNRSI